MTVNPARTVSAAGTEPKKMFYGIYLASVVNTNDPKRTNRVTLKVPQVLGTAVSNWALPAAGAALPAVGKTVFAMFIGGDINRPVYLESNL